MRTLTLGCDFTTNSYRPKLIRVKKMYLNRESQNHTAEFNGIQRHYMPSQNTALNIRDMSENVTHNNT